MGTICFGAGTNVALRQYHSKVAVEWHLSLLHYRDRCVLSVLVSPNVDRSYKFKTNNEASYRYKYAHHRLNNYYVL